MIDRRKTIQQLMRETNIEKEVKAKIVFPPDPAIEEPRKEESFDDIVKRIERESNSRLPDEEEEDEKDFTP